MSRFFSRALEIGKRTFAQWRGQDSSQLAAALAFYGAIALAGAVLIALYVAGAVASHEFKSAVSNQARRTNGTHNAQFLEFLLREAAARHDGWIALVVGCAAFIVAGAATALQIQRVIDAVWCSPGDAPAKTARQARKHTPQFLSIFLLALILAILLFAGAAVHGLLTRTHGVSLGTAILYQSADVGASVVLLTLVFLFIFAYLPPIAVPWRKVWIASFIAAILYERGQFALSIYLGQMDAKSPYADVGVLLVVLLWLYYSAQVLVIGTALTKVLNQELTATPVA